MCAIFTKWSNTLKQFVGKFPTNCLSVFDHFVGLALKRLNSYLANWWCHQNFITHWVHHLDLNQLTQGQLWASDYYFSDMKVTSSFIMVLGPTVQSSLAHQQKSNQELLNLPVLISQYKKWKIQYMKSLILVFSFGVYLACNFNAPKIVYLSSPDPISLLGVQSLHTK